MIKYKGYLIKEVPAKPKYYIIINHDISTNRKLWGRFKTIKEVKIAINEA